MRRKDYRNYTIKVHAFENISIIEQEIPKLLEDYRGYFGKLSPLYAESEDLPEISAEELNEMYKAVKEFAGNFDIDRIDGVPDCRVQHGLVST